MADLVELLLPGARVGVSTFHRFCARLLRRYAGAVGLQPDYAIYDATDQRRLLRQVISDLDVDPTHFPPGQIGSVISNAKNQLQTAVEFAQAREGSAWLRDVVAARAY